MAVKIRLARGGAKKRPFYSVVAADVRAPRDGRYIEKLGTFNPMLSKDSDERLVLKEDRVKYWLGVGALPTDRVARMLGDLGLTEKFVVREQSKQAQPKAKAVERMKEKEQKAKDKAEAEAAAKAEEEAAKAAAKAAAEAPVAEETSTEEAPAEEAEA